MRKLKRNCSPLFQHFDLYVFGREKVTVHTDHKSLECIMSKPLHNAPKRLQGMLLHLQRYTLQVEYRRGKEIHLADALSRAPVREEAASCKVIEELSEVNHTLALPVCEERWEELRKASSEDEVLCELRKVIQEGCLKVGKTHHDNFSPTLT